ncbi:hypothetical protein CONLIGDRAFT_69275 [Coniochaeta ligniaria NRRL 30616]|uniref:Uncharacterized protein n=1 Tax=Coniochaeta ligniaria NRRL 30616 TaxID=1408157 RepID=A0A1J7IAW4_9PEZI|nr:hypothetical protein CONLIGDRAFT_69275 [Coniochaeta ligniaria NRRL 30616]
MQRSGVRSTQAANFYFFLLGRCEDEVHALRPYHSKRKHVRHEVLISYIFISVLLVLDDKMNLSVPICQAAQSLCWRESLSPGSIVPPRRFSRGTLRAQRAVVDQNKCPNIGQRSMISGDQYCSCPFYRPACLQYCMIRHLSYVLLSLTAQPVTISIKVQRYHRNQMRVFCTLDIFVQNIKPVSADKNWWRSSRRRR